MVSNSQSKDDALEALDFIVNVLKEHEKDLDKLISELATVTEQLGDTGALNTKVDKIEEKMNSMQKEVTTLITYLSSTKPKEAPQTAAPTTQQSTVAPAPQNVGIPPSGPSVIFRCARWEDFQNLAFQAQTLSFSYKEDQKFFEADALKGNRIITYSGVAPNFSAILKTWLSKQLNVAEGNVLEGVLAIG